MARFEIGKVGPENIGKLVKSMVEVRRTGDEVKKNVDAVVRRLQEDIKGAIVKTPLR